MSQMLKSSGSMAAATLTSRLLGMVREMVYARFMGDGWVAGAFQLAFTIPNLFRRLLGEGALTAAFIPVFKEKEKRRTAKKDVANGQRGDFRSCHRRGHHCRACFCLAFPSCWRRINLKPKRNSCCSCCV